MDYVEYLLVGGPGHGRVNRVDPELDSKNRRTFPMPGHEPPPRGANEVEYIDVGIRTDRGQHILLWEGALPRQGAEGRG